jgi:hypothetical protein
MPFIGPIFKKLDPAKIAGAAAESAPPPRADPYPLDPFPVGFRGQFHGDRYRAPQHGLEPRDLVLAFNERKDDLDTALALGLDPETSGYADVSRTIASLNSRIRNTVRAYHEADGLPELAKTWNVTEDELTNFLGLNAPVRQQSVLKHQKLELAAGMIEAANAQGRTLSYKTIADRLTAAGHATTPQSLKVLMVNARNGKSAQPLPDALLGRLQRLRMAPRGRGSADLALLGGAGLGAELLMADNNEAEAGPVKTYEKLFELDPAGIRALDENASQESLNALQKSYVDQGKVPPVFKLFRTEDGRIIAWDAQMMDHAEARHALGLGDQSLEHGQFYWGADLKSTTWYDRTGVKGAIAKAGLASIGGLALWLEGNDAEAGTLTKMLRSGGVPKPPGGYKTVEKVLGNSGLTERTTHYADPSGAFGLQFQLIIDRSLPTGAPEGEFSFTLPVKPEPGTNQQIFAAALGIADKEIERTGLPIYTFLGLSEGHDKLYTSLIQAGLKFPGYRSIILEHNAGVRMFYVVRDDIADGFIQGNTSFARVVFDSKRPKLSPQSQGGAAGVLAAAGAGGAALLGPDQAEAAPRIPRPLTAAETKAAAGKLTPKQAELWRMMREGVSYQAARETIGLTPRQAQVAHDAITAKGFDIPGRTLNQSEQVQILAAQGASVDQIIDRLFPRMKTPVERNAQAARINIELRKNADAIDKLRGDAQFQKWLTGAGLAGAGVAAVGSGQEASAQEGAVARAAIGGVRAVAGNPPAEPLPPSIARGQWSDIAEPPAAPMRATPEAQKQAASDREDQERQLQVPDFWSGTVPAAFRRENVIGSWLSDVRVNDKAGRDAIARGEAKAFDPWSTPGYLDGYEAEAERFADTLTEKEADALKQQIDRERADMRTLALSGGPGFVAQLAAGTIDPTVLIPAGVEWKAGDSLLMFAAKGAWMGASQAAISEGLLQTTQEMRSIDESAQAIVGGSLFGGVLGVGAKALSREKPGAVLQLTDEMRIRPPEEDPLQRAAVADDAAMRVARPQSAGAAAVDKATLEGEALADVFGLDKASGAIGLNPLVRLAQSESPVAREVSNTLMENGMFLKRNNQGKASPLAVETAMQLYRGYEAKAVTAGRKAYRAHRQAGGSLSRTEFMEAVGRAMRRGDESDDPNVKATAQAYRAAIDKMKDEAIKFDLLPEDVAPETAASYFHRMWNRKALASKPEAFRNMASEYLLDAFEGMKRRAFDLEVDIERFKGATEESRAALRDAGKARTKAENDVKSREGMLKAAEKRLREAQTNELNAAVEWRQVKGAVRGDLSEAQVARLQKLEQDQTAFQKVVEREKRRIENLNEELDYHRPIAEAKSKDYDTAKRTHEETRGTSKLSDEDAKLVDQVKQLLEMERVEGSLAGFANQVAGDIYRQLMGFDERTLPTRLTIMDRGPLASRTFNIPDLFRSARPGLEAAVEDFLVDDAEHVLARYMRVMSADVELARAFGDPAMTKAFKDVNADYDTLVAQADKRIRQEFKDKAAAAGKPVDQEKLSKALEGEKRDIEARRKKDLKDITGVRDILRGNYGSPAKYDDLFVRGAGFVRNWNYITMLGGMTASSFVDMAQKVLSNGFLGIARDLMVPLVTDMRGVKIAAGDARDAGVAVEGALNARVASLADIGDPYGKGTALERTMANIANFFTTWTGQRLWNDVMKTTDYVMAQNRAIRTILSDNPSKRDVRWLAWAGVGLSEPMAARIRTQLETHADLDRGMRQPNMDLWDDEDAVRAFKGVMAKEASTVTITPGAGDKLLAAHGELGKTIIQFKTFAFAGHQRLTLRMLQQGRAGDAALLSYVFTGVTMGMMVYAFKMWDSGRQTSDNPATWIREGIDRSGMLPLFFEAYNSAEKVLSPGDKHPLKWLFVGDQASRYNSRGPFAAMLGPGVGRVEDVFGFVRGAADGKLKDTDVNAVRKLLPFQNLWFLRQLLDRAEFGLIDALGAEKTQYSKTRKAA